MRRRVAAASAVCLVVGAVSCSTGTESGPVDLRESNHVALGDSYSSMGSREAPLLGPQYCLRSDDNYPSLLDADTDVTCQGAVTGHIVGTRVTPDGELPAQVDALGPDTDVVTLTIGGNDIGFGPIVDCVGRSMKEHVTSACQRMLGETVQMEMDELPQLLDDVHHQIRERTGGDGDSAVVLATGYMPLIGPRDTRGNCPGLAFVSSEDVTWAKGLFEQLNGMIREAAERHDARYVMPEGFANHSACADRPGERWVDFLGERTDAYPMHPTSAGQRAMADAVETAAENP